MSYHPHLGKRSPSQRRQHLLSWGLYVSLGSEANLQILSGKFETSERDRREIAQAAAALVRLQTYLRTQMRQIA